jgi:hypothetical protein
MIWIVGVSVIGIKGMIPTIVIWINGMVVVVIVVVRLIITVRITVARLATSVVPLIDHFGGLLCRFNSLFCLPFRFHLFIPILVMRGGFSD